MIKFILLFYSIQTSIHTTLFMKDQGYKGAFQVVLVVKNQPAKAGDIRDSGLTPGSERSPGGGHSNPLQYSCLENPMDGGAWWPAVQRVTKSWT